MTALKEQTVEFYEDTIGFIRLEDIAQRGVSGVIDWTTATAASLKVTTERGGGTTLISKTLADATVTSTSIEFPIAVADWAAATPNTRYWWELAVNFGAGLEKVVESSSCHFRASEV